MTMMAVALTSSTALASLCRRMTRRRCVSLVSPTNRRHWEIRGACIVRVYVFAWSLVAVAVRKAVVDDVVPVDESMILLGI
jgi:hypothetical protein